jgi:osmotically-inducible protein OsmY
MHFKTLFVLGAVGTALYLSATKRGKHQLQQLREQASGAAQGVDLSRPSTVVEKVKRTVAGTRQGRSGDGLPDMPQTGVGADSSSAADDFKLARQVESTLSLNPHFTPGRIIVSADRGRVTLRGTTDAGEHITQLEQSARGVPGVTDVENLLHLQGSPQPTQHRGGLAREAVEQTITQDTEV